MTEPTPPATQPSRDLAPQPRRGGLRGWPLAIVLFFAIVIAANAVFIYLAVSTADPVVASYHTDVNR
jgi:nitrogen fixation protein FixH